MLNYTVTQIENPFRCNMQRLQNEVWEISFVYVAKLFRNDEIFASGKKAINLFNQVSFYIIFVIPSNLYFNIIIYLGNQLKAQILIIETEA